MKRRHSKQNMSLRDRLAAWAAQAREKAKKLPPGPERQTQFKRASQADVASHLDEWANSPGSQPPK